MANLLICSNESYGGLDVQGKAYFVQHVALVLCHQVNQVGLLYDSQVAQPLPNGKTSLAPPSFSMLMTVPVSQPMFRHGKFSCPIVWL